MRQPVLERVSHHVPSRSIPQELQAFVPNLPSLPVAPIIQRGQEPYAMFADLGRHRPWVLNVHYYSDENTLIAELRTRVIEPAEAKARELTR